MVDNFGLESRKFQLLFSIGRVCEAIDTEVDLFIESISVKGKHKQAFFRAASEDAHEELLKVIEEENAKF